MDSKTVSESGCGKKSRVGKKLREGKRSWEEAGPDIASFFAELDVLFLYDRENQKKWFEGIVFNWKPRDEHPEIVDLLKMAQFFLPDGRKTEAPDIKALIKLSISESVWETL